MNLTLFWQKVEKSESCWVWKAAKDRDGYGVWSTREGGRLKQYRVHRLSFSIANDGIDNSLTIDHLCKNKLCLNPAHLEQVTIGENVRRSDSFNRLKTHCKNGHEFNEANTYNGPGRQHRQCKKCHAVRESQRYTRLKESK